MTNRVVSGAFDMKKLKEDISRLIDSIETTAETDGAIQEYFPEKGVLIGEVIELDDKNADTMRQVGCCEFAEEIILPDGTSARVSRPIYGSRVVSVNGHHYAFISREAEEDLDRVMYLVEMAALQAEVTA